MYDIPYFKEPDHELVLQFMKAHSFATLIGCSDDIPVASQVPLLIEQREGKLVLRGHMMRNTDHHKALCRNGNVLCVFTGAHAYVSARLYNDPATASTWNYLSVQAAGVLRFVGEDELVSILQHTTNHYEGDPASPANFEHLPQAYVSKLARAIDGFEIEVTSIRHVFKLSQNKSQAEHARIVDSLAKGGAEEQALASEMSARCAARASK
jgi:transcriptional regulator